MIEILGVWVTYLIIQWALFDIDKDKWEDNKDYYKQIPR
jgi:hypothetical protein